MSHNHYLSSSLLLFCFSFPILFPYANAFNITKILGQYPEFSTFNNFLTQTQLDSVINSRQTVTVLVVENGNMVPFIGKPVDFMRKVLSVHVILDYYDVQKLQKLSNKTAILTTLYQASGLAVGGQGFLNVTILRTQTVAFGSAVPGSNLNSNLVKSVASHPYNISVLEVSNVIVPPGINGSPPSQTPSSTPKSAPTPATSPTPVSKAPAPSTPTPPITVTPPSSAPKASPVASPPVPVAVSPTPSTADTPASVDPGAVTPVASPPGQTGLAPAADGPTADAPAEPSHKNAAAKYNAGTWVSLFVMSLSLVYLII